MNNSNLSLIHSNSEHPDFAQLVVFLDAELKAWDGDDHAFFAQFNKSHLLNQVLIVYKDGVAVGCGALKKYSDKIVEIKRMFVKSEFRGQGISSVVLSELEKWAVELGFSQAILETGKKQIAALHLYQKSGYQRIPNYGQYENIDLSVCMGKPLL